MPRFSACCFVTVVSAARQPDSDPICEKPIVRDFAETLDARHAVTTAVAAHSALFILNPPRDDKKTDGRRFGI
jgi:hypothetical protein